MAYTNKGQIQKYLAVDIDNSFDTQVDNWITAVTNWIDNYVGHSFEAGSAENRFYDTNGEISFNLPDRIINDGSVTVTILESDGTTDTTLTEGHANDFLIYPLNETWGNEIVLTVHNSIGTFRVGRRRLQVNAKFGHSETAPQLIQLIATKLCGEILKEGIKGGKLESVQLGDYEARFQHINEKSEQLGIYNSLDQYRDVKL